MWVNLNKDLYDKYLLGIARQKGQHTKVDP